MEVVVVQGPVRILRQITDRILSCKGVISCKLTLTDIIIPQVHSAPAGRRVTSNSARKLKIRSKLQ